MTTKPNYARLQEQAISLTKSIGLDPEIIAVDNADEDGYNQFGINTDGARIYTDDGPVMTRVEWPADADPEAVARLVALMRQMGGYYA